MSAAQDEPIRLEALARALNTSPASLSMVCDQIEHAGLVLFAPAEEPELPSILKRAGEQYLALKGQVDSDALFFLPYLVDDLYARQALIQAGSVLVDEFRHAIVRGDGAEHAAQLVPPAFSEAVDDRLAIDLFAAAVALMARLSCGEPAGCLAEEILAVGLLDRAELWLEMQHESGDLIHTDLRTAKGELRGVFELFQDDDVLDMFDMVEPADAAIAGHSRIHQEMGVVDQRLESWFRPFGGVVDTGHLYDRD